MDTTTQPLAADRLAAIEAAINAGSASPDDLRDLLAEVKRARTYGDDQYMEADYWREGYRLAKGLSMDEIGAIIAVRDASKCHPRPCNFPHQPCLCDDDPEDEGEHEECLGIHNSSDGYRDCDGNPI
ncbi:hypothetical protein [Streptomyces chartreusis]|uniref:hypothetical protein n=1 Tax=Streptomyces chartreusis TaxID=1969 RepID=UPI00364D47B5